MAFDFKKEYKDLYIPSKKPSIVTVPPMNYVAVRGCGDPNIEGGAYKESIGMLYAIEYTIKMSKMTPYKIDDYFDYVVPPLEGFWWQEDAKAVDFSRKEDFQWISAIRLPDFVTREVFDWAKAEATIKKELDLSKAEFFQHDEGFCVQCLYVGPYDDEPATIAAMDEYALDQGYALDFTDARHHHEIYLSDPRRVSPEKLKTVIRHPIRKAC